MRWHYLRIIDRPALRSGNPYKFRCWIDDKRMLGNAKHGNIVHRVTEYRIRSMDADAPKRNRLVLVGGNRQ